MKAIVFGSNGQDGPFLKNLLEKNNIEHIGVSRKGDFIIGSVANTDFVEILIKREKPDFIFHLAANSTTRHDVIFENHETICTGTVNILESVKKHSPDSKVFLSGSGLQFENKGLPIHESDSFEATSPYAVARIQSVYLGRYYRKLGLKVYSGYFFNHESPGRSERHISKMISEACKRIKNGSHEKISLGDIRVKKEWTYAGDVVEGIWTLMSQESIFEATIGSGIAYSIQDWLELCFSKSGMDWRDHYLPKDNYVSEYNTLVSNPSTLKSLGWSPKTDLSKLADMMLA